MQLSVVPLHAGDLVVDKSLMTPRRDFGVKVKAPSVIWYIDGSNKKILVDTSFKDARASSKMHAPFVVERGPEQEIVRILGKIGVKPEEIDIVILTHLHWDHSQNNDLFKNAECIIQREELRYAIAPLPPHRGQYEALTAGMRPGWLDTPKVSMIDGDREIADGVSVICTPGHTPGFQSVVVQTQKGRIVIAADTVNTYENWGSSKLGTHLPGGIYVNLEHYWQSLEKIERIADIVLPGHDAAVFKKDRYP